MTRSISSTILDKLEEKEITSFDLIEFTVNSTTYRYTNAEVPITYAVDGTSEVTFETRGFVFDNIRYSSNDIVDGCDLTIDNLDSVLSSVFLDNVINEDYISLYIILFNNDNGIIGSQKLFKGILNNFNLDEVEVKLTATSIFTKWNQQSTGHHSTLCRWKKFKGTECKYVGSETFCDRTYNSCSSYSNTNNFGGFRWIPSIEDKKIWWGPTQSERNHELGV